MAGRMNILGCLIGSHDALTLVATGNVSGPRSRSGVSLKSIQQCHGGPAELLHRARTLRSVRSWRNALGLLGSLRLLRLLRLAWLLLSLYALWDARMPFLERASIEHGPLNLRG